MRFFPAIKKLLSLNHYDTLNPWQELMIQFLKQSACIAAGHTLNHAPG